MGLEIVVPRTAPVALPQVLETLEAAGLPSAVAMVDRVLQGPGAVPPAEWREVRLRTPAGMVTLARRPGGVAVVVFGNADPALQDAQRQVADALRIPAPPRS